MRQAVDEGRGPVAFRTRGISNTGEDLLAILESQPGARRVRIKPGSQAGRPVPNGVDTCRRE
jgi:hypothetical protein